MDAGKELDDLEQFEVWNDGARFNRPDFNFWGVTFARDSNLFYATLASAGKTYLVVGNISERTLQVLRENVECPSLSPDNTRLAFKKRVGDVGVWRLHILDLNTLEDTPLTAETHTIDDQVEWLDDNNVLYAYAAHIWVAPVDGGSAPTVFASEAYSPAVNSSQ